ncbi:MAG: DUF1080 domain-containing protein [Planctomycetota bacterium]|nr:DUF1080 domain-containing protein [Planctomycetota bacterium]
MRNLLWLAVLALVFAVPATIAATSSDDLATMPKWESLLPPADLAGWKSLGGSATYRVEDSMIIGRTTPGSPNTWLITERQFGDFELEYEFRCDPSLNSGVQIRSEARGGSARGFQVEIDVDEKRKRFWSAGLYEEGDRGWIGDLKDNPEARAAHKLDDWNHVRVVAVGAHMQTWLNGVAAAEVFDTRRLSGFIGLQVHGVGNRKEPLQIRWRNLRIRDLGMHLWSPMTLPPTQGWAGQIDLPEDCRTFRVVLSDDKDAEAVQFNWKDNEVKFTRGRVRYSYSGQPTSEEVLAGGGGSTGFSGRFQVFSGDETSTTLVLGDGSSRVRWPGPGPVGDRRIMLSGQRSRILSFDALIPAKMAKKSQD